MTADTPCPAADARPWVPWMRRALQLAELGRGRTSPNPLVGAVVLDAGGQLVGEGYHARAGEPHAEVGALAQAGERAKGGTLVVTLELCCHHNRPLSLQLPGVFVELPVPPYVVAEWRSLLHAP